MLPHVVALASASRNLRSGWASRRALSPAPSAASVALMFSNSSASPKGSVPTRSGCSPAFWPGRSAPPERNRIRPWPTMSAAFSPEPSPCITVSRNQRCSDLWNFLGFIFNATLKRCSIGAGSRRRKTSPHTSQRFRFRQRFGNASSPPCSAGKRASVAGRVSK